MSEVSSEAVEAAARALGDRALDGAGFDGFMVGSQEGFRIEARAALTAALPHLSPRVAPSAEEVAGLRFVEAQPESGPHKPAMPAHYVDDATGKMFALDWYEDLVRKANASHEELRARTETKGGRVMAEEYTPSTEGVRDDYANWRVWVSSNLPKTVLTGRAEFDRWLAAHDAQVKAEAWDEGASVHARSANAMTPMTATYRLNPHRAAETEAGR